MLIDEVKARMIAAMKAKDVLAKEILRVTLGDLQMTETRQARAITDEEAVAVIRKIIKSNEETIGLSGDPAVKEKLAKENEVLGDLMPKTLSVEQIVAALAPVADAIKAAGNDGQATGAAVKHLKSAGAAVEGKDVAVAVKQMRAG
ncbi:MAG: hypothetical protein GC162_19320 [Planctomycetes bacterium]|nr:hypothetical protein [Planctomycetota bacterium]